MATLKGSTEAPLFGLQAKETVGQGSQCWARKRHKVILILIAVQVKRKHYNNNNTNYQATAFATKLEAKEKPFRTEYSLVDSRQRTNTNTTRNTHSARFATL